MTLIGHASHEFPALTLISLSSPSYEPTQTNIDQQPYYPGATSGFLRSPVAAAAALANPANEPLIGGSAAVATEEVLASQYGPPLGERTSYQSSYGYRYNNGYGNNGYGSKGRAPYPPRGQFGVKY